MKTKEFATHVQGILLRLLTRMVLRPDLLEIHCIPMSSTVLLSIRGGRGDTARLIGEGGAHFRAIKAIAEAMGMRHGIPVQCESILEPNAGEADRYARFSANPDWPRKEIEELMSDVAMAVFSSPVIEVTTKVLHSQSSVLLVSVDTMENPMFVRSMIPHLTALFAAIGKAIGQLLYVDVSATLQAEHQPR